MSEKQIFVIENEEFSSLLSWSELEHSCTRKSNSTWNNGSFSKPSESLFIGVLGETAVGRLISAEPDLSVGYTKKNEIDFNISDTTFEVKTTKTNDLMVRCVDEVGRRLVLKADFYIGVKLLSLDYDRSYAALQVQGLISKEELLLLPDTPARSRNGNWWNKVVPHSELAYIG